MLQDERLIDGKYRLIRQIGRGGMSVVYLAVDVRLQKEWAVKEVAKRAEGIRHEWIVHSLAAEVNLMKKLDHPALPRIVDVSEDAEKIYIVMDYIRGTSLDRVLRREGAQPEERVIGWGILLCDALRYLHGQKPPVIYRDMKPSNVMLTEEGGLKLIDFGIAREYKARNLSDTESLGTRGYAPPEQYGGRQTDPRSDIYALGMTMHHLLTGTDPRLPGYVYVPVRQIRPELSAGLERIIDRCTAPDPRQRYPDCGELLYDLRHPEAAAEAAGKKKRQRTRIRVCLAVLAAALAVCGGGSCFWEMGKNGRDAGQLLAVSASAPYEVKVESYLEAIRLSGGDARGYIRLLRAYRERGVFGSRESQQFLHAFETHREEFDQKSTAYLDLLYEAGITYFYLYSDGENREADFAERVLKSYPYFQEISRQGTGKYRYFDIACSYLAVGEFYARYMADAASVQEPAQENYRELLDAVSVCLKGADGYDGADSAYVKLSLYQAVLNLLNAHRKGFALTGVGRGEVEAVYRSVYQGAEAVSVTQQVSVHLRETILGGKEKYLENLERAYVNTGAPGSG